MINCLIVEVTATDLGHSRDVVPRPRVLCILQLEGLDILAGCVGWQLESQAADTGTLGASLCLGELFHLHVAPATGEPSRS